MNNWDPFKNQNSSKATSGSKNKKSKIKKAQNFIEAFKDLGSGISGSVKSDVAKGLKDSAGNQIRSLFGGGPKRNKSQGSLESGQSLDLKKAWQEREAQIRREERRFAQQRRQEEKVVYSRKDEQIKLEVKAIRQELKNVAKQAGVMGQQLEKASFNAVVSPGTYHLNFFERLRQVLTELRKKLSESNTWLTACNKRVQKRSHYWRQVKKSGTKFMLSQERYMATQMG